VHLKVKELPEILLSIGFMAVHGFHRSTQVYIICCDHKYVAWDVEQVFYPFQHLDGVVGTASI